MSNDFVRVSHDELRRFMARSFEAAGLPQADALKIATLMAEAERQVREHLAVLHGTSTRDWELIGSYAIPYALPAMLPPLQVLPLQLAQQPVLPRVPLPEHLPPQAHLVQTLRQAQAPARPVQRPAQKPSSPRSKSHTIT